MKMFYDEFILVSLDESTVSPIGKCKKITYLIQDSKESRGHQKLKENNIIFTLER
jgi:hypothetical protein